MLNRNSKAFVFFTLLWMLLLAFPSSSLSDDIKVWTNLGLYGGQIYDIAIDPVNPDKMFAGSYQGDGLFLTTDGGNSWTAVVAAEEVEGEDTFKNHAVYAVEIAQSNNSVVWAAHNYWVEKSVDGGQTWTHILNGGMQAPSGNTCPNCPDYDQFRFCYAIAIDPDDPQTVYVSTGGRYTNYEPCGAIYRTEDGGVTWSKMNGPDTACWPGSGNFDFEVVDLAIDPNNHNVIWAVTNDSGKNPGYDGTLYRCEIDGAGIDACEEIFSMGGGGFWNVEVKPNDSNAIFTAHKLGIFRHYYEDNVWKYERILDYEGPVPPPDGQVIAGTVRGLAFDPTNPDILYASWKNSLGQWPNVDTGAKIAKGIFPYTDADWEINSVNNEFLTLAVRPSDDPSPSNIILGGKIFEGVYISNDQGQTWVPINNGINALIINDVEVDPNDATHIIVGTGPGVFARRGDEDWVLTSQLDAAAMSVAFDPTDNSGNSYFVGTRYKVAKTTDNGANWIYSNELTDQWVLDIEIAPGGNTIFAATRPVSGNESGVYKSDNGGVMFSRVLSSDKFYFSVVTIDPSDSDHVFAGSGNFFGTKVLGNLYESKNGGDINTWELTGLTDVIVNDLLIDPRDSNVMYAGCGYSGGTLVPVYKSIDAGQTWLPSFEGIPIRGIQARGVGGYSGTDVFIVGDMGDILHYNGSSFTAMRSGSINRLYYVWMTSLSDVFVAGEAGTLLRYNGNGWVTEDSGTTEDLRGIWGSSATNVFAVGNAGTLLHYNLSNWENIDMSSLTTENFRNIWGTSENDIFICGYAGTILHYDGNNWTAMNTGTTEMILGIWGSSGTDVFAVGGNGIILHYDGNAWTPMNSGTGEELQSVWGASGTDVFAVGMNGTIIHYDGQTWSGMDIGTTEYIWRVWGASGTDVFAVGTGSNILHYNGDTWTNTIPEVKSWNSVTDLDFHREYKEVIFAATDQQGVYVSPNMAGNWLNLGTPEYAVRAISTSSLYAATKAGLLQCTGTGVIAGQITDSHSNAGLDNATVLTDLGINTRTVNGEYMMVCPAGIVDVAVIADGHANMTMENLEVLGGDVNWAYFPMELGVSDPSFAFVKTGKSSSGGGGYCFIGTAGYDSFLAKHFISFLILIGCIGVYKIAQLRKKL